MKTTKVKSVQSSGSFKSQWGAEQPNGEKLLFIYDYEFTDGTFLQANHKTVPSPFKVGDTVEYEVTRESEQYGKSGKVSKPEMSVYAKSTMPTDDSLQGRIIGHAITNAVQLAIFNIKDQEFTEVDIQKLIKIYSKMILKIGEELSKEISKESNVVTAPVIKSLIKQEHQKPATSFLSEEYTNTDRMIDNEATDDIPL